MKPYLKYLFEVIAIVVGITLSFMVDEWREDQQRYEDGILLLQGIKMEMIDNQDQLVEVMEWGERGRTASLKLMDLFAGRGGTIIEDSVLVWLRDFEMNYTFDPRLGILESGIASGHINYLGNLELKRQLAGFKDAVVDVNESTNEFGEIRNREYYPNVNKYYSVRPIWATFYSELEGSRFKPNLEGLFADMEMETVFTNLTILKRQGLDEQMILHDKIERIIKLIDQELEGQ